MTDTTQGALPSLNEDDLEVLGAPSSKTKSKSNASKLFYLIAILGAFLFLVFGLLYISKNGEKKEESTVVNKLEELKPGFAQKNEALENKSIEQAKAEIKKQDAELQAANDKAAQDAALAAMAAEQAQAPAAAQSAPVASNGQPAAPAPPTPKERKLAGSVIFDAYAEKNGQPRSQGTAVPAGQLNQADNNNPNDISAKLKPSTLDGRLAGRLPNLDYLLKRGVTIPCALKTGINTTLSGFVICNVISDVYSANGKTLLIERGASIFGEQQSNLKQGQERVFVLWTRVDNPSGVSADLDSPGTDQMGFNGVPGFVDTHFFDRFGAAIMIS